MLKDQKPTYESRHFTFWRLDNLGFFKFKLIPMQDFIKVNFKEEILQFIDRVSSDDSITVVVLYQPTGSQNREELLNFYKAISTRYGYRESAMKLFNAYKSLILSIIRSRTFFISVKTGEATLSALCLGIACDYFMVSDKTIFENPAVELGLIPDGGIGFFLPRLIGRRKTMELLLKGENLTSQEALKMGLVDRVVPEGDLEEDTLQMARLLTHVPSTSLASVKRVVNFSIKDLEEFFNLENRELDRCLIRSKRFKSLIKQDDTI